MLGIKVVLALSPLLTGVLAGTCVLPEDASFNNGDAAKRLSILWPPTAEGQPYGSRVCRKAKYETLEKVYDHWLCAYKPDLYDHKKCSNDYNTFHQFVDQPAIDNPGYFYEESCHADTTTNPPQNNGVWVCG